MEGLWGIVTIVGPILLLGAIIWAWRSNRKAGPASQARADAAGARLNDQLNDEDQRRSS